jgi:hypothetical protein
MRDGRWRRWLVIGDWVGVGIAVLDLELYTVQGWVFGRVGLYVWKRNLIFYLLCIS